MVSKLYLALVGWLLVLALVSGEEISAKEKDLLTDNSLTEETSFRCGIFFAGAAINDKPRAKIFILPKRFETTCPAVETETHKNDCMSIFKFFTSDKTYTTPSRRRKDKGKTIGDDLCQLLKDEGMKVLPPKNPRFKNGMSIGFYYNVCTDKTWYDTGVRVPDNLCCNDDANYIPCPT